MDSGFLDVDDFISNLSMERYTKQNLSLSKFQENDDFIICKNNTKY